MNTQAIPYDILKTVGGDEIEQATREGWRLVAVLTENRIEYALQNKPITSVVSAHFDQAKDSCGYDVLRDNRGNDVHVVGHSLDHINNVVEVPMVVSVTRFLMGMSQDHAIADLEAKLHQQASELTDMQGALDKAKEQADAFLDRAKGAENMRDYWQGLNKRTTEERREESDRRRKLEGDLAKLRTAIGGLRYDEIVGLKEG